MKTLPNPTFYDPKRAAAYDYRPDAATIATAANAWRAQHSHSRITWAIQSGCDDMRLWGISNASITSACGYAAQIPSASFFDMIEAEKVEKLMERNVIEVAPLAFMRGRTLNDSFIILDEAQNSTPEQMKMFLTRQGFNSRMVVNGDLTQIDLPIGRRSGLQDAVDVLRGVEGLGFVYFGEQDVVRHPLVQRIVRAYERYGDMNGPGRQMALRLEKTAEGASADGPAEPPEAQPEDNRTAD